MDPPAGIGEAGRPCTIPGGTYQEEDPVLSFLTRTILLFGNPDLSGRIMDRAETKGWNVYSTGNGASLPHFCSLKSAEGFVEGFTSAICDRFADWRFLPGLKW
jgi:hypothetical protein